MRVSHQALSSSYVNPVMASVASKLARTFTMQMDALGRTRGKVGRQVIKVKKYEEHRHIHVHEGPGGGNSGARADASKGRGVEKVVNLTALRLSNMAKAPRCQAKTRAGGSCRSAVVKGKQRCRMHGGAKRSGGPKGKANGAYRSGAWTNEAKATTKQARKLMARVRRTLTSYGIETTEAPSGN